MDNLDLVQLKQREVHYHEQSSINLQMTKNMVKKDTMTSAEREYYGGILKQELDARNDMAMENAQRFQPKVETESNKKKKGRREDYEENMLKYGGGVTMETAAMQRNLRRFQKSWAKEMKKPDLGKMADNLDLSADLFDITMIKGSKQHIDIRRIMNTLMTLRAIQNNENGFANNYDQLSAVQRAKIAIGLNVLPTLEHTVATLLGDHALDESGKIILKRTNAAETSENVGIAEIVSESEMMGHSADMETSAEAYRRALGESFAAVRNREELNFTDQEHADIRNLEMTDGEQYENHVKRFHRFEELLNKREFQDEQRAGIEQLMLHCLNCYDEFDRLSVEMEAKKKRLSQLEAKKHPTDEERSLMEKLRMSILADSHREAYRDAEHQSRRLERMFRGVCEGKPMTTAMRMELAAVYGLTEYRIEPFDQEQHQHVEDTYGIPTNAKEMKERGRLEKRADRFQNYLGARSIASLTESERNDNAELIAFIEQHDNQRKEKIGDLETWLGNAAQSGEISTLKGSLLLEEETARDATMMEKADEVLDWIGKVDEYLSHLGVVGAGMQLAMGGGFAETLVGKAFAHFGTITNEIKLAVGIAKGNGAFKLMKNMSDAERAKLILGKGKAILSGINMIFKEITRWGGVSFGPLGAVLGVASGGMDITTQAIGMQDAHDRMHDTKRQMEEFEERLKNIRNNPAEHQNQEGKDLERFQRILGAAKQNANIDYADSSVKTATATVKFANSLFIKAVSAPISTIISSGTILTERLSERIAASRKATLRREYVKKNYETILNQIRQNDSFRELSDRDIKHTFLRFLGVKSGKYSEGGIRNMAVDSSYLLRDMAPGQMGAERYEGELANKRSTLKAMGIASEKATRSKVMKAMGATAKQAANPLLESNRIYREQLSRSKDYNEGGLKRGLRHVWRWFTRD